MAALASAGEQPSRRRVVDADVNLDLAGGPRFSPERGRTPARAMLTGRGAVSAMHLVWSGLRREINADALWAFLLLPSSRCGDHRSNPMRCFVRVEWFP